MSPSDSVSKPPRPERFPPAGWAVLAACMIAVAGIFLSVSRPKQSPPPVPVMHGEEFDLQMRNAKMLAQEGKAKEAADALERASRANPTDTTSLVQRAGLLSNLGRSREAMEAMRRAHELAPNDAAITLELLRIAPATLPAAEREAYARLAVQQSEEKAISHYYLGLAIAGANDPARYPEALACFNKANTLAPQQQLIPLEMGKLYCRMGDYTRGAAWVESAWALIDLHDRDGSTPVMEVVRQRQSAAFWMAECYRKLGRTAQAKSATAQAEKYAAQVREIEALQVRAAAIPPDPEAAARLRKIESRSRQ